VPATVPKYSLPEPYLGTRNPIPADINPSSRFSTNLAQHGLPPNYYNERVNGPETNNSRARMIENVELLTKLDK